MKTTSFVLFVLFSFCALTCKKESPVAPPPDESFSLKVADVNCTEAWLTLHVGSGFAIHTAQLTRDTAVVASITLIGTDTTIANTGLSPSHTYTYTLSLAGVVTVTTQATTMDTTSSSFTWQMFTLGGASNSALYDVAIINDTLAYAVGQIFLNDSTGQIDQQPYNLATWDGKSWKIQKVPYYYQGQPLYGPIYSLAAFNANDIWFGIGNMIHWDGQAFHAVELPISVWGPNRINKIWGLSSQNFYIAGDGGSLAHYNGSSWAKIESGTSLDFQDIYGAQNANTGNLEIYATAGDPAISPDRTVLQISGITAQAISTAGIFWALNGIWFSPGQYYWLVGDGTWEKHPTLSTSSWTSQALTGYTIDAVRGNAINDVFMCGAYGEFLHFNGVSWRSYISQTGIDGAYGGLAVHGNTVIAVGEEAPQAVILMGKR